MHASEQLDYPDGDGQHWSLYVTEYAVTLFTLLTGPGQLIGQFFGGGLGPGVEIDRAEMWLEAMNDKGFDAEAALLLMRQMGEIVVGGAVTAIHKSAIETTGISFADAARAAMAARDPAQIPLVISQQAGFAQRNPVWPQTLVKLLEATAKERGEELDLEALKRCLQPALPQT